MRVERGKRSFDVNFDRLFVLSILISVFMLVKIKIVLLGLMFFSLHPCFAQPSQKPSTVLEINENSSRFGNSLARADFNGDGYDDLAVGAPLYRGTGAVFIYHGSHAGLLTTASVVLQGDNPNDLFGVSIASGDFNGDGHPDLLVGVPNWDTNAAPPGFVPWPIYGAAYVYKGTSSGINKDSRFRITAARSIYVEVNGKKVKRPFCSFRSDFGVSLSNAGDVNGDGLDDMVIGAPSWSNGQTTEGAVLIFYGEKNLYRNVWYTYSQIIIESNEERSQFGYAVSGAGDVNNDGYEDIVVGAPFYSSSTHNNKGAVYVFQGTDTGEYAMNKTGGVISSPFESWSFVHQNDARVGMSVAHGGDLNADGFDDVLVGVPGYTNGQWQEGQCRILFGSKSRVGALSASVESNQADSRFGFAVSPLGDVNGDNLPDIGIGSPYFKINQDREGSIFIATKNKSTYFQHDTTVIASNHENAGLGGAIIGGDFNGDGISDVAAGATHYNEGNTVNEGGVFVYHGIAPTTNIPDINFERELIALGLDRVIDGKVITGNIVDVESLKLIKKGIENLTGIQDFKGLKNLEVDGNLLTNINLDSNLNLIQLTVSENRLKILDLSGNKELKLLICSRNELEKLNLPEGDNFQRLVCTNTKLKELDLSMYPNMDFLICDNNSELGSLDLRNGNNYSMLRFSALNNNQLSCISVDDVVWSTANWDTLIDSTCIFSVDCSKSSINYMKKANGCIIYPNPTLGELRIDRIQPGAIFCIKSESGMTVMNGQLKSNNLNLADLSPGIYFVEIISDGRRVYKLIKM